MQCVWGNFGVISVLFLAGAAQGEVTSSVVAVSVVAAIVGAVCFTLVAFIVFYMKKNLKTLFS